MQKRWLARKALFDCGNDLPNIPYFPYLKGTLKKSGYNSRFSGLFSCFSLLCICESFLPLQKKALERLQNRKKRWRRWKDFFCLPAKKQRRLQRISVSLTLQFNTPRLSFLALCKSFSVRRFTKGNLWNLCVYDFLSKSAMETFFEHCRTDLRQRPNEPYLRSVNLFRQQGRTAYIPFWTRF